MQLGVYEKAAILNVFSVYFFRSLLQNQTMSDLLVI